MPSRIQPCHQSVPNKHVVLFLSLLLLAVVPRVFALATAPEGDTTADAAARGPPALLQQVPGLLHQRPQDGEEAVRAEIREMFAHAYSSYMRHAFPSDELAPLKCTGARATETAGGGMLTLIDSLDMLAVVGEHAELARAAGLIERHYRNGFDIDETVSVFETNIRVLGGLLSGHLMLLARRGPAGPAKSADSAAPSGHATGTQTYSGGLLRLAEDLGRRLLRAFDTPTGVPYGAVNLRRGVMSVTQHFFFFFFGHPEFGPPPPPA